MDYKKRLMEYRKSIGATTSSTIMRTVAFRDPAFNLNEAVEKSGNTTKGFKKPIETAIASPITTTVSFQDSVSSSDKPYKQKHTSQLSAQPQQRLQHRTLQDFENDDFIGKTKQTTTSEYRKYFEAIIPSSTVKSIPIKDLAKNIDKPDNQKNALLLKDQSLQHLQHCKLLNIEEDILGSEDRQSSTRESSALRISSSSPSPQPQSHQLVISTPRHLRETGLLLKPTGRYVNWNSHHAFLASQPWCCIGDLMALCDKYEFKAISVSDVQIHANIISEVRSLLSGKAPFDLRRRFPGNIRNTENLFVCIGRCPSIEYHLKRILADFRRPLNKLSIEKQNIAKQNFHLAVRELHLDISARISDIKLYDRYVFEKEFHLKWQDDLE